MKNNPLPLKQKEIILSKTTITTFQKTILDHYKNNKRSFPWRNHTDPYAVLVSEIMLQQTQVSRVMTKFPEWMKAFPNWKSLASADLASVLHIWQGMGYNRRAKALRDIATIIIDKHHSKLPANQAILQTLPWIGPHTAGSICAFAFNQPTIFIETNIRTVFIHHFFPNQTNISDQELKPLVTQTIYKKSPRDWYNAIMDYGTHIKSLNSNPSRKSKHYTKQSKFEGSNRQIRGLILKHLTQTPLSKLKLKELINDKRIDEIINKLIEEKMITQTKQTLHLST